MARLSTSFHPKFTELAISNLRSKKIYTVFDFMQEDSEKLTQYSGLSYQEILELKKATAKFYIGGIRTGTDLLKASYNSVITTGITSLDYLLKGGLRGGQIYEICGSSSSGKSQLCHTVAVNVAQKYEQAVHYIDTKGDFCATRIQSILESKKCDEDLAGLVLERIIVTRIETINELFNLLHSMKSSRIKLIIIDSLTAIFFNTDIESRGANFESLNNFTNLIRCVASESNAAFITVNLVSQWREMNSFEPIEFKNPLIVKPMLGKYWLTIPSTRLLVETGNLESRKITVSKSTYLSSGSTCNVIIKNTGVV